MPVTNNVRIVIDNTDAEVGEINNTGISLSYALENPENFEQKQGSISLDISLPATPNNDRLFNHFHNPRVEDQTTDKRYGSLRKCNIIVGGVEILRGVSILQSASHTRLPGGYNINCYGQNGDWSIEMKDLSLWHCLSDNTHTFDVATVENSWFLFDSDENHDYVYAPVRYRQPFGDNDDTVDIFHLRPSLSIYWMIIRAFRQFGYRVQSDFFSSAYFRGMVMPWVWGSFFDVAGPVSDGLAFKAAGPIPISGYYFYYVTGSFSGYVFSSGINVFRIDNTVPPQGYDHFGLYSFDEGSGKMIWTYAPPSSIATFVGDNISVNFSMKLHAKSEAEHVFAGTARWVHVWIEVTHIYASGAPDAVTLIDYDNLTVTDGTKDYLLSGATQAFSVSGINNGDTLEFRIKIESSGDPECGFSVSSTRIDTVSPGVQLTSYSTLELSTLQLEVGGTVNLKFYDKFKGYRFMDMFRGLVDLFNLSLQTNPIDKIVTIEPTHDYRLPVSGFSGGYFKTNRLDWSDKQDVSKENVVSLYSDTERQLDFQYKQDGSDGGQNIYAGRYKGIYLNNTTTSKVNNTNIDNGIIAGVPGASRYMFPNRFRKGARQMVNRFFSATMHYRHKAWDNITGVGSPTPQLIAIIPENINDSSASAVSQIFEPKIAFYKGPLPMADIGGWRWVGDPKSPYSEFVATSFQLPLMFSVNYGTGGETDPVLSYCDQKINGTIVPGLMKTFFLKRLAIMRHGRQYRPWVHLNNGDMINWLHRESIILSGAKYYLIGVEQYNPLTDDSSKCVLWKVVEPEQADLDSIYPSEDSLNGVILLSQFDLRYAPLLLYNQDIPQI